LKRSAKPMPDIQVPGWLVSGLQVLFAFFAAFMVALWLSMIVWTFRDAKSRSRDPFGILLGTLMVVIFGPLGLLLYILLRPKTTLVEQYERALEEEALLQDLEEKPRCSGCSRVVEHHWVVCPDCHTQLKRTCLQCGEKLNLRWNICPACGTGINQAAPLMHRHQNRNHLQAAQAAGSAQAGTSAIAGGQPTSPHEPTRGAASTPIPFKPPESSREPIPEGENPATTPAPTQETENPA
jgi:RNA polymerase subunit RPABC4/transcription elongation factor Spt4